MLNYLLKNIILWRRVKRRFVTNSRESVFIWNKLQLSYGISFFFCRAIDECASTLVVIYSMSTTSIYSYEAVTGHLVSATNIFKKQPNENTQFTNQLPKRAFHFSSQKRFRVYNDRYGVDPDWSSLFQFIPYLRFEQSLKSFNWKKFAFISYRLE